MGQKIYECFPKTITECAAGSYFTATGKFKDNTCTSCGEHCNQDQWYGECMTIYGSYTPEVAIVSAARREWINGVMARLVGVADKPLASYSAPKSSL